MKKIFDAVKNNPLFYGIGADDFDAMLNCIQANLQIYQKGEIALLAGAPVKAVGLIISGSVQVFREDGDGRQNLMAEVQEGELFGEVFACAGVAQSPVTVVSVQKSEILYLDYRKVIGACASFCPFHQKLIQNMLALVAQKNLMLNQKIEILSKRTTRERLLLFFDFFRKGSKQFVIPFNREKLAAYLCVDRSAMSSELSKMQKEGLIRYHRNVFELLLPSTGIPKE